MIKLLVILIAVLAPTGIAQGQYYPAPGEWQSKAAAELGFESDKLEKAVRFATDNEYSGSRDLRIAILKGFEREPFHTLRGPVKPRGGPAGMVVKNGYIAAQWGDLSRVDMTFSVTKSYLSSVAGVAVDLGLIGSTQDKVKDIVWDGTYQGEHNSEIRWRDLLDQSSDWSGTLFGIKDWADRPPQHGGLDDWKFRDLNAPGTVMEYNDVRVNLLAYSLLQVFRQPLPQVLKQHIMDPIGASPTWRWFGYDDAWVTVDGLKMKSVTGGGHSGGGIFISTLDQARFGLMVLRNGRWENKQILSEHWLQQATAPSPANASYGFMWWLNQGDRKWKNVDDSSIFYAAGFGGNFVVVDKAQELMIVTRWLEPSQIGEMVRLVRDSLQQ